MEQALCHCPAVASGKFCEGGYRLTARQATVWLRLVRPGPARPALQASQREGAKLVGSRLSSSLSHPVLAPPPARASRGGIPGPLDSTTRYM